MGASFSFQCIYGRAGAGESRKLLRDWSQSTDLRQNSPAICCFRDSPNQTGLHFVSLGFAGTQTDNFKIPIRYVIHFSLESTAVQFLPPWRPSQNSVFVLLMLPSPHWLSEPAPWELLVTDTRVVIPKPEVHAQAAGPETRTEMTKSGSSTWRCSRPTRALAAISASKFGFKIMYCNRDVNFVLKCETFLLNF